mmetsp:Transcript_3867/g.8233  ORF Transcript_3867/g.8233 Transcript_3867/m.8233 type:complete len:191 (-) Transcript_3867:130-702(-)
MVVPDSKDDGEAPEDAKETDTPAMPVIGRIQSGPQHPPRPVQNDKSRAPRVVVPQRAVNGGLDFKFDSDPRRVKLHNLLTPDQYNDAVNRLNDELRPGRSNRIDVALLITGPLMLPLAAWSIRHSKQVKRRKRLLSEGMDKFNAAHPGLLMRWNKGLESFLTIEQAGDETRAGGAHGTMSLPISGEDTFV